jgi:hypothetical protein
VLAYSRRRGGHGRDPMSTLAALAHDLRARHFATETLVLANVWDASSARAVAEAGHPAIATSSAAVAASLGTCDHEQMTADEAFGAVGRIAHAVDVPVTADLEAGYGLAASELVDRLLAAGAASAATSKTPITMDKARFSMWTPRRPTSRRSAGRLGQGEWTSSSTPEWTCTYGTPSRRTSSLKRRYGEGIGTSTLAPLACIPSGSPMKGRSLASSRRWEVP